MSKANSSKLRRRVEMRRMLLTHDPHCWFCGKRLDDVTATLDHFVPLSRGGTDEPSNYRLACAVCNHTKDSLPLEQLVCPLPRGFGLIPISVLGEDATMATIQGFNYSAIEDTKARKAAREHAKAIPVQLEQTAKSVVDIGRRLIEIYETLGRNNFQAWIRAEFRWSQPVASNYMQCARKFGDLDCLAYLQPSALIVLARGNVPSEAVDDAIEQAGNKEIVTHKQAQELIAAHSPPRGITDAGDDDEAAPVQPTESANIVTAGASSLAASVDSIRASVDLFCIQLAEMAPELDREERELLAAKLQELAATLLTDAVDETPAVVEPTKPIRRRRTTRKPTNDKENPKSRRRTQSKKTTSDSKSGDTRRTSRREPAAA